MITIFTPIYNRAHIINNLYQSLLHQTCYEFEWLIVDDGSTDNLPGIVERWIEETYQFKIRFYQQKNGGKHRAINYGVKLARYNAFFIVDSDDYLEYDTVETIQEYWTKIDGDHSIAGISGLRRNESGEIIGSVPFFDDYMDVNNLERDRFGLSGDKAEVYKTELLREFPFPEFENETFITEAAVWDRIAYEGYKVRWINKSFIICEYFQDGLTQKGEQLFVDNPRGWAYFLHSNREYRKEKESVYLRKCYCYYENEHVKFTDEEIKKLLKLGETEINLIKDQYNEFVKKIWNICSNKSVCIYAYGRWGKRLKSYLDFLEIQVAYVVDKEFENIKDIEAYSIDMILPSVDIIFIAVKNKGKEMKRKVDDKLPEAKGILLADIIPEFW